MLQYLLVDQPVNLFGTYHFTIINNSERIRAACLVVLSNLVMQTTRPPNHFCSIYDVLTCIRGHNCVAAH